VQLPAQPQKSETVGGLQNRGAWRTLESLRRGLIIYVIRSEFCASAQLLGNFVLPISVLGRFGQFSCAQFVLDHLELWII
jgi:hypothetical protein